MRAFLSPRLLLPLLVGSLFGCTADGELPPSKQAKLYSSLLTDTTLQVAPERAALDPQLMSQSGTYEFSGMLDSTVVAELTARSLFREICHLGKREHGIYDCVVQEARVAIRFSRPRPLGKDSVAVYVGRGTVYPASDTSSFPVPYFGMTHKCVATRERGVWRVRECRLTMIT